MALISVLWALVILSLIAASVLSSGVLSYRLQRNAERRAQAEALADAAVARAVLGLVDQRIENRWPVDGRPVDFAFEGVHAEVRIQDELGKIDINAADASLLSGLLVSVGLRGEEAAALVDKILDWRDANPASGRPHGAELADYQAAGLAYAPRNGPFQSVDELRLVLGMRGDIFLKIEPAITVYSKKPTFDPALAPPQALLSLPGMDESKVEDMIAARGDASTDSNQGTMLASGVMSEFIPLAGRSYSISVTLPGPAQRSKRRAVIMLSGDATRPYLTLSAR